MMSSQRRNQSTSSSQIDYLNLCKTIVEDLARGEILLNKEQCKDLASKLSSIAQNVEELVPSPEGSSPLFRPALEDLYRYFERAKVLVSKCRDEDWCAAAVFQSQNENAFRDILLDVGLCYNAIYEQAKRKSGDRIDLPHDLRQSPEFDPAPGSKVNVDKADLLERLNDLANEYIDIKLWDRLIARKAAKMKSLANYLLVKMDYTSKELQADNLDSYSAMLWTKASQPYGTWAKSHFLGAGSGATGVYRTTWLGIPCAKKEFHGQESESCFLKEAGILAHLKHPCIVNLICCGNGLKKGDRFIAMELMEKSLFHLIEEQKEQKGVPFSLPVAVDMMVQIARGVCYLHDRGVAHRDLKPQNVVVSRVTSPHLSEDHFTVKLVDFGMSKTKVEVSKSNTMTAGGIGTTRYRAPEIFPQAYWSGRGKATWFKADVYSFAMTCAHLLSLKSPFEEMQSTGALYEKLGKGERPELPDDCPKELVGLLKKCWSIRPGSRPSFMQVCVELEKLRHAFLSGYGGAREGVQDNIVAMSAGFDFIEGKVDKQSALHAPLVDSIVEEEEGLLDDGELPILACTAGHALEFLPQVPSSAKFWRHCNLCWEDIVDEHYHCRACDFDIHSHCSRLEIEVNVFFHKHSFQLLMRSYYHENPDAVCCFCEESLQHSEWVYRCEQCDFDVHAHCTKHPEEIMRKSRHEHRLTLIQCPPGKCLSCVCCNGEIRGNTWRYTCTERWCTYDLHPSCAIFIPFSLDCIFDKGHRLSLSRERRGFYCGSCGGFGYSWYFHCDGCDVNIHLDCAYDMEEEDNWIEVYEQFKAQYMTKGDLTQISVDTISRLLDELLVSDNLGGSSLLASGPKPVVEGSTTRVQPTIRRLALCDTPDLDAIDFDDADLRKKIVAETAERKAKRMRAKAGRLELKVKYLEMLGDLESAILDLQSSEIVLLGDGEALEKVRKWKDVVEDEMATLVQSRVRQFCRTGVFFLDRYKERGVMELLTSLQADMVDVWLMFLCEEPGHEHEVEGSLGLTLNGALGEEREGILKPLLARGLEVVAKAMSASLGELSPLESVTLPILGSGRRWDLRAIDVEKHGKVSQNKENAEELKRGEDFAAEWLLSRLEKHGTNLCKDYGLLRVRYKETEEGDLPRYTRGSVAWLCKDHVNRGLKDGILESYPLKYYNPELN